jgi:hypothetical protein
MQRTNVMARIGIVGAFLATFGGGLALAEHGYSMKEHPLRGDFPTADVVAVRPAYTATTNHLMIYQRPHAVAMREHPLRGEFPAVVADAVDLKRYEGFSELRLEEVRLQPGAELDPDTMSTAFMCEVMQGEVVAIAGETRIRHGAGDLWACPLRAAALHESTGATPAVLHVLHVIPE